VDFEMSSQAHAIQAVDLLRAAGHEDASHIPRGSATREHIISVRTDQAGVEFEVVRLVQAVDPDAQPLGPGSRPHQQS
jgi:hypothetical protein